MSKATEPKADLYSENAKERLQYWKNEIDNAKRRYKTFWETAKKISNKYRDSSAHNIKADAQSTQGRYNIFWSNIETLRPSLYNRTPVPVVTRRFYDKDPVGRLASTILERNLVIQLDKYTFDDQIDLAVKDYTICALGQAWVEYIPIYGDPIPDPDYETPEQHAAEGAGDIDGEPEGNEIPVDGEPETPTIKPVIGERCQCRYIHYSDYLEGEARQSDIVPWKAKGEFMNKRQVKERFGEEIAKAADYSYDTPMNDKDKQNVYAESGKLARVWEIWCWATKKRYIMVDGVTDGLADEQDDPLNLEGFYPCPEPLLGTTSTDSRIPTPDYMMIQHQLDQMNELTERIKLLTEALKVVGLYDGGSGADLKRVLKSKDNMMIKVDKWAAFAEKGGIKGALQFMPIEEIAVVLAKLYEARERLKADIGELTGMSDIVRGMTNPNETLGAQQLKANFSGVRMSDRRKKIANFVRDIMRIKAEIIVQNFDDRRLWDAAGCQFIPEAVENVVDKVTGQTIPQPSKVFTDAIALLKNDTERLFRIDIESDSTIQQNESEEKQQATEFLTAMGGFIKSAAEICLQDPEMKPLMGKLLLFGMRRYRVGSTMESEFEQFLDKQNEQASQPKGPSPQELQMQAEAKLEQQKLQGNQQLQLQKLQGEMQIKQTESANDMQLQREQMAGQMELEREKAAEQLHIQRQTAVLKATTPPETNFNA